MELENDEEEIIIFGEKERDVIRRAFLLIDEMREGDIGELGQERPNVDLQKVREV